MPSLCATVSTVMKRVIGFLVIGVLATAGMACTSDNQTLTDPSLVGVVPVTADFFSGSIGKLESSFYSFSVTSPGPVNVTLVSLTTNTSGRPPTSAVMRLGFGVPSGTGCQIVNTATATPGLVSQFSEQSAAGLYCVEIRDVGNLTGATTFVVRIAHS